MAPPLFEVPFLFPDERAEYYAIDDVKKEIFSTDVAETREEDFVDEELLRGSASFNYLSSTTIITTALIDNPSYLSVTSTKTNVTFKVDLKRFTTNFQETRKVQAFEDTVQPGRIRLNIVDQNATVVSIFFHVDTMVPESRIKIINIADILNEDRNMPDIALTSNTIAFLAHNRVLIAPSPILVAVHLDRGTLKSWLEFQTVDKMKAKKSTIKYVSGLILGGIDRNLDMNDMRPVTCLTVFDSDIFTLHSDATLRHWIVQNEYLEPEQVEATSLEEDLPHVGSWDDSDQAVLMATMVIDKVYSLAISIQTTSRVGAGYQKHLLFAAGTTSDDEYMSLRTRQLNVEDNTDSVVGLDFHENSHLYVLQESGKLLEYPSGAPEPIVHDDDMLSSLAEAEKHHWLSLSVMDTIEAETLNKALRMLDKQWMQQIFRPSFCRATGTLGAPSVQDIHRALRELGMSFEASSKSLELRVLQSVNRMRNEEMSHDVSILVRADESEQGLGTVVSDDESNFSQELLEQERRWRTLCLEIFKKQLDRRRPLRLCVPGRPGEVGVIVRSSCVSSVIPRTKSFDSAGPLAALDAAVSEFESRAESNKDLMRPIYEAERKLRDAIDSGSFAYGSLYSEELEAAIKEVGWQGTPQHFQSLLKTATSTEDAMKKDLMVFDLDFLGDITRSRSLIVYRGIEDIHSRLTVCCLTNRLLTRFVRRAFYRYVVLLHIPSSSPGLQQMAFTAYLHVLTVLWVSNQHVPIRSHGEDSSGSPVSKRQSPARTMFHRLGSFVPHEYTLTSDSFLFALARQEGVHDDGHLIPIITYTRKILGDMLSVSANMKGTNVQDSSQLPELSWLSSLEPRLVLRLVAPFLVYRNYPASEDLKRARSLAKAKSLASIASTQTELDKGKQLIHIAITSLDRESMGREESILSIIAIQQPLDRKPELARLVLFEISEIMKVWNSAGSKPTSEIWTKVFEAAMRAHSWNEAFEFAVSNPNVEKRASALKRLVRGMADAGYFEEFIGLCFVNEVSKDMRASAFRNVVDLFGIGQESLADVSGSIGQAISSSGGDYLGLLYALHISKEQWREGAQTMDIRCRRFTKAILDSVSVRQGKSDLANELSNSCLLSSNSLRLSDSDFIVGGEHGPYPSVPLSVMANDSAKRSRSLQENVEDPNQGNRADRYLGSEDLSILAVQSMCLKAYIKAEDFEVDDLPRIVNEFTTIKEGHSAIRRLFETSNTTLGLILANVLQSKSELSVKGVTCLQIALQTLIRDYLLPLPEGVDEKAQAHLDTLCYLDVLEICSGLTSKPFPVLSQNSLTSSTLTKAIRENASETLIRALLARFSERFPGLLKSIATAYASQDPLCALPPWLETMAFKAGQKSPDDNFYRGGLSPILSLYVSSGRLIDACRVAKQLLASSSKKVGNLPEKGHIIDIPYDSIDELLTVIDAVKENSMADSNYVETISELREDLLGELNEHFRLLKLAEDSIQYQRVI